MTAWSAHIPRRAREPFREFFVSDIALVLLVRREEGILLKKEARRVQWVKGTSASVERLLARGHKWLLQVPCCE